MTTKDPTAHIFWLVAVLVVAIALGSFGLSYTAQLALAIDNGIPQRLAWIWPLIVDVSVIVFTAAILVSQLQRRGAKLAIFLTGFYASVTIAGNVLHAPATSLGWFVAILPPLSLIFATEMLRAMAHHNILQRGKVVTLATLETAIDAARTELDAITRQADDKRQKLARLKEEISQTKHLTVAAKRDNSTRFIPGDLEMLDRANEARDDKIAMRRQQVLALLDAGFDKEAIAAELNVSPRTIHRDLQSLNGGIQQ